MLSLLAGCADGWRTVERKVADALGPTAAAPPATAAGEAAATFDSRPLEAYMPPAAQPTFRPGDSFTFRFPSGSRQTEVVVAARGERTDWRLGSGATWTTRTSTMFNTEKWSGTASFGTGTQRFSGELGKLFPLAVGKSIRYRAASGDGAWVNEWTCSVAAQERVEVAAGAFDCYRVICSREGQIRTFYYAPSVGMYVLRITTGRDAGTKELASFSRAN
ncbi:MAG: hypothetical protein KIT81_14195 [Alphaproteobacteria bacterium]|nr:hypothetical protein [Alphaproteobacteria bacterium]